jgi:tRNA A-37 threonylcarbamoyl transferase component Bud32
VAAPERRADVERWLASGGAEAGAEVAKDNRVRSVHRWKGLYVKRFKPGNILQRVRSRLNDKALHEYRILLGLRERGIEVPRPAAWARHAGSTWLFTEEIPGARALKDLPLDRPLLRRLADFVRRLHAAGLRNDDLHLGNLLLSGGSIHLIDVHRAELLPSLTPAEEAESAGFLLLSLVTKISRSEALRFIHGCGADVRETLAAFRTHRDRYYRDRQSRVWRDGSDFEVRDGVSVRRPLPYQEGLRLLDAPPGRLVKDLPGRRLWQVDARSFVKEGARRAWSNGFGLETRGIPTPRLLAARGDRIAGEWIEGALPLWEHVRRHGVSRPFLEHLAGLLRRMHERGVEHRDLKANNVIVRDGAVWIIDVDRVRFTREAGREARVLNLAQLNAATGAPVTRTDRLRFWFAYAGSNRERRLNWKAWVREVMAKTVERRHHWPPGPPEATCR